MTQTSVVPVTFQSGDLALEGALHLPSATPAPGVVVCHPHPQYGGDMDNNVVMAACESLTASGSAALRFNFRGVGASMGAFDRGLGERDDVRAALRHLGELPEVDGGRIGLVGYSFGAIMAAEVASGALRALALISPPLEFSDVRVAWGCPALIIAGDCDQLVPPERVELLGEQAGVETHIVEDADHSWFGFEDDLGAALATFFARHFR